MSSCLSLNPSLPNESIPWPKRLSIAIIGPEDRLRRSVVSALNHSRHDDVFEFHSYPPKRGYLRTVMENGFDILILELDSDVKLALDLIHEASEVQGAAILAYSKDADSKLKLACLNAGALVYSVGDDATEISHAVDRLAAAFFPQDPGSEAPKESSIIFAPPADYHCNGEEQLPPAVLPRDFDDWDDHAASNPSLQSPTTMQAGQHADPDGDESLESGLVFVSSVFQASEIEEANWRSLKEGKSNAHHPYLPQSLKELADSNPADAAAKLSDDPLGLSNEIEWKPVLITDGEEHTIRNIDQSQMRQTDDAIFQMFRTKTKEAPEASITKGRKKIVASFSLATTLVLIMSIVAWSRPEITVAISHTVLNGSMVKIMRADAHTRAPGNHAPGM